MGDSHVGEDLAQGGVAHILIQIDGANHRSPNSLLPWLGLEQKILRSPVAEAIEEHMDFMTLSKASKLCGWVATFHLPKKVYS